jgi:RNA polymerase I-specific transcription initiation factor RRN7
MITKASNLFPIAEQTSEIPAVDGGDQEDLRETEKSGTEDDSEMEELLRQNSEISSSSDEDDSDDPARIPERAKIDGRRKAAVQAIESLASTLAVMMISLWQLRIPVMYNDFARFV